MSHYSKSFKLAMQIPCLNKLLRRDSAGLMWDRGASNMMQTKTKTHRQNCIYDRANKSLLYYYHLCKWWNFNIPNLQSPEVVVAHSVVEKSERPQSFQHWSSNLRSWLLVPCWFLTKHCEGNSKYNVESNTTNACFNALVLEYNVFFCWIVASPCPTWWMAASSC